MYNHERIVGAKIILIILSLYFQLENPYFYNLSSFCRAYPVNALYFHATKLYVYMYAIQRYDFVFYFFIAYFKEARRGRNCQE